MRRRYPLDELRAIQEAIAADPNFRTAGISLVAIDSDLGGITIGVRDANDKARKLAAVANSTVPITYRRMNVIPVPPRFPS